MRPSTMVSAGETEEPEGDDMAPEAAPSGGKEPAPSPEKLFKSHLKTVEGWKTRPIRVRTGGKLTHGAAADFRRSLTEAFKKQLDKEPALTFKSVTEPSHSDYMEHWKRFADHSEKAGRSFTMYFYELIKNRRKTCSPICAA